MYSQYATVASIAASEGAGIPAVFSSGSRQPLALAPPLKSPCGPNLRSTNSCTAASIDRADLSSTRSGFTLLSFPRRPVIAPDPAGIRRLRTQAGHRLNEPGLADGAEHDHDPDERDHSSARDRQKARYARLERVPLERPPRVDH